jgi:hypothetical protein
MSGAPSVGTTFTVGIDNPSGSMPLGSVALLAISLLPDPAYPCGTVVPGLAMTAAGAPGEVLVSLNSLLFPFFAGPAWTGPGVPAPFVFGIPYAPFLVGQTVFLQGALLDPASMRLGATSGLEVRLGP